MNVTKIITAVAKMTGSKISATYNKEAIAQALKHSKGAKLLEETPLGELKNPFVDVAMKSSKNGYTIGAFRLRDGNEVIANGAASVTGLGTPKSVVKYRFSLGDKGKAARVSAFVDNNHKYKLADLEVYLARKKGITNLVEKQGKAVRGEITVNEKETANWIDKLLGRESGTTCEQIRDAVNEYGANGQSIIKKFLNGQMPKKEIDYLQNIAEKLQGNFGIY